MRFRSLIAFNGTRAGAFFALGSVLATLFVAAAPAAQAQSVVFTDTLAGPNTFNRPINTSALSTIGTAVFYDVQPFFVSTTGEYSLLVDSAFDSYLVIYQDSFNPSTPLTNVYFVNDDFSGFDAGSNGVSFTAGTQYQFVTTSFSNGETGPFTTTIGATRPAGSAVTLGNVNPVPEPSEWLAMGMAGTSVMGLMIRARSRRRRK